ncbi:MAG: cysteine desulfurase, partial [Gluconacetobacter diazotrophicus]|nr:cysteine desulfurase [Gluconacetobacter diazotrophicus]
PPGKVVLVSEMEHHANIVPWQMLRDRAGVALRVVPVTADGELDLVAYEAELARGDVALVAITHMSNVLGTVTPAAELVRLAHAHGARILLDGSQAAVHGPVDVSALDTDFYVFTGHKLYGPTGIGVLYAKRELLEAMPPFMGGGDMIGTVSFERSTWAEIPHKFEAGTPPILEVIGLGAAIDYVSAIGMDALADWDRALTAHALTALKQVEGLRVFGDARERGGVVSFAVEGAHAHDLATLLDQDGIAVRAGTHCAEPLMRRFGVTSTTRASFGLYSTTDEIDALVRSLNKARAILG